MCGIIGIVSDQPVAPALALGLQAIQHRGQDAAGIGTYYNQQFKVFKDTGLINQAIPAIVVELLAGTIGIGHVRYPTVGSHSQEDAQPFMNQEKNVIIAHNGNITNVEEARSYLQNHGVKIKTTCDAELILAILTLEIAKFSTEINREQFALALQQTMKKLKGGYAVCLVAVVDGKETLIAFRDPNGFRPLVWGEKSVTHIIASESVSLDVLNCSYCGSIKPGEVGFFVSGEKPQFIKLDTLVKPRPCVFEDIYFARADSMSECGRVYLTRQKFGIKLAEQLRQKNIEADVVVAIPDTSRPAAAAIAEELGLPNREGFVKNRYSTRTFIMPSQDERESALLLKLNPISEILEKQRIILVDDSIVRGLTMKRIVGLLRKLQVKEVHLAIVSPPVMHPCFYGIDMPSYEELIAPKYIPTEEKLAEYFGVDSLTYLSQQDLDDVIGPSCSACFTGVYPEVVTAAERAFFVNTRRD